MAMRALLAIGMLAPSLAHAEGEYGPMIGASIVAAHGDATDVAGAGAELALWYGPLGVGIEGQQRWLVDEVDGPRLTTVTGSLRVLALRHIIPSFLDAREVVELGIELHGLVERGWWSEGASDGRARYGLGAALRLRGATDDDRSNLLAESRVFVRVMRAREDELDRGIAARASAPDAREGVVVLIGLGAMWGGGSPAYVNRLRRENTLDAESIVR